VLGLVLVLVPLGIVVHVLLSRLIPGAGDDAAREAPLHRSAWNGAQDGVVRPAPDDDPAFLRSLRERPDGRGPEDSPPQA
jgi:hypothetical protein